MQMCQSRSIVIHHCLQSSAEIERLPTVSTAATLMRKLAYNNKDALTAGLIVGGWDPYKGGQVYCIPLGGTIMRDGCATGGMCIRSY
jgi:20S proteasome subunit beta 1